MAACQVLVLVVTCMFLCAATTDTKDDRPMKDALREILLEEQMLQEQSELHNVDDSALAKTESVINKVKNALNKGIDKLRAKVKQAPCNYLRKRMKKIKRGIFSKQGNVLELKPRNGEYIYLRELIPIKGLNIKLTLMRFDCSGYELTISTAPSQKQTIIPHFMSISGWTVSMTVTLTDPANTLQLDINGNWKIGNLNIAVNLMYSRSNGNTIVTATPNRKTTVKRFIKSITGLSLPINPTVNFGFKFVGYIDKNDFTTLAITSDRGQNKFYAIYQKQGKNTKSATGIAIDVKQLKFSSIIRKVINLDISKVPFFGSLKVRELGLAYGTDNIINLDRAEFRNSLMLQRMNGQINKGLTAYLAVPFHNDPIKITYQNRVLVLTTPQKNLRLDRVLKYLVSGGGKLKLSLPPQIRNIFKINIEDVVIDKNSVTVDVSYPKRITFFKKIFALSNVKVSVTIAKQNPKVSAVVSGIIHLAGANFDTTLSPNQQGKYVLTAKGDKLDINKLFKQLHSAVLPKIISKFLSRIPFLNFKINKPTITYVFGSKPLQFQLGGTPIVQGFSVTRVETLIVKLGAKTKAILGFELGTFKFADILKKITKFNFRRFPILNQMVTSTVIISPVSTRKLHFSSKKLASMSITKGVSLSASMRFPRNCKGDKFCKFAGRLIGHTAVFTLKATISSATYFPISASINNLYLGNGIILGRAGIEIVGGKLPSIGLVGEVRLKKPPLIFAARISLGTKGLSLQLSVTNCWYKAFNRGWLDICNLIGSIDFAPPTGITGLAFGGEIRLGYKSTGHQITAKGYIGVSIISPLENYYYVKFSRITMGSLLKAFKIRWKLPKPLAQSGFPRGFLSSFSFSGKELPEVHLSIPAGYRLKGTLNILGLQGSADIIISLPKGIDIKVALPPIRIGRILAMYASSRDQKRGPFLKAKVQVLPRFKVHIEAGGYLKVLGISLETRLKITNTQYEYFIRGKILHLFQASLHITAKYGNIKRASFRVRGEFKLDLFNGIKRIAKNLFRNIAKGAKKAFDVANRVVKKLVGLWKKAKKAVSRAWRKVKNFVRGIFRVNVMQYCEGKSCRKAASQGFFRKLKRAGRRFARKAKRVGRRVIRKAKRVGRRAVRGFKRAVKKTIRKGKKLVGKGLKFVGKKFKKLLKWAKKAYNKAKKALSRVAKKLKNARKALDLVKKTFKVGLQIFKYIIKHGIGGIISIRRLWFDVSLGSASLGKFAGGVDLRFLGKYKLKFSLSFNLRKIASLAKSIFKKVVGKIKKIFG